MTHTTVTTTHYYLQYSHRSIISLHGSFAEHCYFFLLGLQWLLVFFLVTFFPSPNLLFNRYFFSGYFLSEHLLFHVRV